MSKVSYIGSWDPKLCVHLKTKRYLLADFNRFLVADFPSTDKLQSGLKFKDAKRKDFVINLKTQFDKKLAEGISPETLYTVFNKCSLYLRWCDKEGFTTTQASLEGYMAHLHNRVMSGSLKRTTYGNIRAYMVTLFTQYLHYPNSFFDNVITMDKSDTEPFESYSRADLNKLLPLLRSLFNQTYNQFTENPITHINSRKNEKTMQFLWKGETYLICGGISKMMCAATYLLSYYTYANTSDLLSIKQPKLSNSMSDEVWYTMPTFKRRAFKIISIEIGEHNLSIPKYSIDFFDKLLRASRAINDDNESNLLQTIVRGKPKPLTNGILNSFLRIWFEKEFNITDQRGRRLRPIISRFRETGSQITSYHQGEIANKIMLSNEQLTFQRHYNTGNKLKNRAMLQDVMSLKQEQAKSKVGIEKAKENIGLEFTVIEKENKINFPMLSRTPSGSSCKLPFGEKSELYMRNASKHRLLKNGEKLACADLLNCFGCQHQVIVQSVDDIWCLLSFKAAIEESLVLHLDSHHHRKNFEKVIIFINEEIIPKLKKETLKKSNEKISTHGYHPVWSQIDDHLTI